MLEDRTETYYSVMEITLPNPPEPEGCDHSVGISSTKKTPWDLVFETFYNVGEGRRLPYTPIKAGGDAVSQKTCTPTQLGEKV